MIRLVGMEVEGALVAGTGVQGRDFIVVLMIKRLLSWN